METLFDILICAVPIWAAVMIGMLIWWSWRPRWTAFGLIFIALRSKFRFIWTVPVGLVARQFWFAFTAPSVLPFYRLLWFNFYRRSRKMDNSSAPELMDSSPAPPRHSDVVDVCGGDIKGRRRSLKAANHSRQIRETRRIITDQHLIEN